MIVLTNKLRLQLRGSIYLGTKALMSTDARSAWLAPKVIFQGERETGRVFPISTDARTSEADTTPLFFSARGCVSGREGGRSPGEVGVNDCGL